MGTSFFFYNMPIYVSIIKQFIYCIFPLSYAKTYPSYLCLPQPNQTPCHDYFYHLKHVSFCAFHPKDHRYFGFITKHPTIQRFACHVFRSNDSTRPVTEAVGYVAKNTHYRHGMFLSYSVYLRSAACIAKVN